MARELKGMCLENIDTFMVTLVVALFFKFCWPFNSKRFGSLGVLDHNP
jgi:hypothetical protein